jgi:acetolactate synthase-1/2/3 large subunit
VSDIAIDQVAAVLRAGRKVGFLLRGEALRGAGLRAAGRIAAATGAQLICDTFAPRLERGAGRVRVARMPYRPADAIAFLTGLDSLVIVGSQAPVAFFAYPDEPSELTPSGCVPLILSHPHEDGPGALEAVADAIGARAQHGPSEHRPPDLPLGGRLNAESIMRIVGHHLPEQAIISDESLTSGFGPYSLLDTAAPHDHLQLTGGSIGQGIPLATGAAVACPDRKVISLEGDGSAMYTLQALWTQARENLDVLTVIYANRSYKVLNEELAIVGAGAPGPKAFSMLDLHGPELDWVRLAEGMGVEAVSVDDTAGMEKAMRLAVEHRGPRLIEAVI